MILSVNQCIKNALHNGFHDAIMNSRFIIDAYKLYKEEGEDIYTSIILQKKSNYCKKDICTLYNRAKIYYTKDFEDANVNNKYTKIPEKSPLDSEIIFVKNGLKIYFVASYIHKAEGNFDLTMTSHLHNTFVKHYLKENGLSNIIYKIVFEVVSKSSDDDIIGLFADVDTTHSTACSGSGSGSGSG